MKERHGNYETKAEYRGDDIFKELQAVAASPARDYKDRVFRMLFKEKDRALELYNAMNGTTYTDADDLEITTLENALYLGMKNDVSFVLYDQLLLYEHQSTKNPNLPLRDLFYVACVYSRMTADKNLYSSVIIKIPEPRFVVFYNGTEKLPEKQQLRLSDAYEHPSGEPDLELKVAVLNINSGYNEELKGRSRTLYEYMIFVETVRRRAKTMPFPEAMKEAIDVCIREGILEEFLMENRAEVEKVAIFEYNEEKHMKQIESEAFQEGVREGEKRGRQEGEKRGEQSGRMKGKKTFVCNLLKHGMSDEEICSLVECDREFLEEVRASL